MSNKLEEIEKEITPIIESCGCKLIEVEYAKEGDDMTLTIFIDKDGGVTIDDCEKVHNAIDSKIEDIDISNGESYNLSVSSFGLTRQLKTTKEFLYRLNQDIDIKLFNNQYGKKEFTGKLIEVNDNSIILQIDGENKEFDRKDIANAKLSIDF